MHEEDESDDIDPTEYFSDEPKDEVDSTPEGAPPTPPKPREEAGTFCIRLDHDEDLDITEYFTESKDEDLDDPKW